MEDTHHHHPGPRDARTLDYLRDVVGFLTYLADNGAVAVLDPQTFTLWSPERWRSELFAPDGPVPHRHVVILTSEDQRPDRLWFHTRGMRKFGRPDLSLRGVAESQKAPPSSTCSTDSSGSRPLDGMVPEGEKIRMAGLPPGLTCHHRGDLDDPDFNNVHLEIEGLAGGSSSRPQASPTRCRSSTPPSPSMGIGWSSSCAGGSAWPSRRRRSIGRLSMWSSD